MTIRDLRVILTNVADQDLTVRELRYRLFQVKEQEAQIEPLKLGHLTKKSLSEEEFDQTYEDLQAENAQIEALQTEFNATNTAR